MVAINVVMTDPPGADSCFVEVETDDGRSIRIGEWNRREDGLWALRITEDDLAQAAAP